MTSALKRSLSRVLIAACVVAAGVAVVLATRDHGYRVRAVFADAAGLRSNSDVKIDGVPVGHVVSLRVTPQSTALVELSLRSNAGPVGLDASAAIRPANLLGEKYVDLNPGDRIHAAPRGFTIPLARTSTPIELDSVIDLLDQPTRVRLELLIDESGIALDGRGADMAALLRALPPALDHTGELVAAFAQDNQALRRALDDGERVAGAVAAQHRALGRLVDSGTGALATLASRADSLGRTVEQAPETLAQLRRTLRQLDGTGATLAPAATGLTRSAPALTAMLRSLPSFAVAAEPSLRAARDVAPALNQLGVGAQPFVHQLAPAAASLQRFASLSRDTTSNFDAAATDMLGSIEGWTRAIQTRDGLGHMFRTQLVLSNDLIKTLIDQYVRAPVRSPTAHPQPARRPAPQPAQASQPPHPAPAPPLRNPLPGAVNQVKQLLQNVTGQAPAPATNVKKLLGYLLGP